MEPRVQLYVPKDETFPIPLKYIDVTRATYTNLDVLQEKAKAIAGHLVFACVRTPGETLCLTPGETLCFARWNQVVMWSNVLTVQFFFVWRERNVSPDT